MVPFNISGSSTQAPSSAIRGGALDAQGQFTFGGISTTGTGGSTSSNAGQSYIPMIIIAVVVVAGAFLVMRR